MKKIINELNRYEQYFAGYNHNIPVIFSTLEGQYQGEIYCDDDEEILILVTRFDFIFLGGNPESEIAEDIVHEIIFDELAKQQGRKEIITFGQNAPWNSLLSRVFVRHNGVCDQRMCYRLNREKFDEITNGFSTDDTKVNLAYERRNESTIDYPVSRVLLENKCVSFCSAFMLAKGYAEIDVATEEEYRHKGFGRTASIVLIKELLQSGIKPNWCTWPYRMESQALAQSIGFELDQEIPAYIWVEEFGF